jgi:hypothetical protein
MYLVRETTNPRQGVTTMLTITTRNQTSPRNKWVARLTMNHPDHEALRKGDSVAHADSEAELLAKLTEKGYSRDETGTWTYTMPKSLYLDLTPYTDDDGVARLGPV